MANRKSNAGARLRKLKIEHQHQLQQLKRETSNELGTLEHGLQQLLRSQAFYHEALMNLLTSENEPDSDTLIGAVIFERWVRNAGAELERELVGYRAGLGR